MPTAADPYEVLGVEPGSSAGEVRKAYLKLARQLHPDIQGNDTPEKAKRLEQVNAAYEELQKGGTGRLGSSRSSTTRRHYVPSVTRRPKSAPTPSVANWTPDDSDREARAILQGRLVGEYVIADNRFDVEPVSGVRQGKPFTELALCIDGCVLQKVEGDIETHDLASEEQHKSFAEQVDHVDELFVQLEADRSLAQDLLKLPKKIPEGATVWIEDVRYRLERVQAEKGPRLVLTRAGRILDDVGPIAETRRRASLGDYRLLRSEIGTVMKEFDRLVDILTARDAYSARLGCQPGDRVQVGGAEYGVYTLECSTEVKTQFGSWGHATGVRPGTLVRPPGVDEPEIAELPDEPKGVGKVTLMVDSARVESPTLGNKKKARAVAYTNVLCRNGRPIEIPPERLLHPELIGFDIRELEAWVQDRPQVAAKLTAMVERRRAQDLAERARREAEALEARAAAAHVNPNGPNPYIVGPYLESEARRAKRRAKKAAKKAGQAPPNFKSDKGHDFGR